jgi:hypothetical protein
LYENITQTSRNEIGLTMAKFKEKKYMLLLAAARIEDTTRRASLNHA